MATSYRESIIDAWDYWCSFQKVKKNRFNGSEVIIDEDVYSPTTAGMLRVGEKVSYLDTTYDIIEKTAIALKPDLSRLSLLDYPSNVDLMLYFSSVILTNGGTSLSITAKPWANANAGNWDKDTEITYDDIVGYYIPFTETSSSYLASTYEVTNSISSNGAASLFKAITNLFIAFMGTSSTGILITATGGYANIFGPGYSSLTVRPSIKVVQTITGKASSFFTLNTEVVSESKVKGVCRDRNGTIIIGRECDIIVFDRNNYKILGTGTSNSATGQFLVSVSCKLGELVVVSFLDSSRNIAGSELMTTFSRNIT